MTADLELRRQAIAEALRAVMAEPFPDRTAPSQPAAAPESAQPANPTPRPALVIVAGLEPATASDPEHVAPHGPDPDPVIEPEPTATPPTLRAALSAQIDWAEVEELEDLDEDWESPSVPPLETTGPMSRTASMALFGHA
jgi:hypothetical protein